MRALMWNIRAAIHAHSFVAVCVAALCVTLWIQQKPGEGAAKPPPRHYIPSESWSLYKSSLGHEWHGSHSYLHHRGQCLPPWWHTDRQASSCSSVLPLGRESGMQPSVPKFLHIACVLFIKSIWIDLQSIQCDRENVLNRYRTKSRAIEGCESHS